MLCILLDLVDIFENTLNMALSELSGSEVSKLLLKHMTLPFLDIILTTRITCACGDRDHITNLILINSTEVIILVLLVRDRVQSILQAYFIQMIQVRLEKNLD